MIGVTSRVKAQERLVSHLTSHTLLCNQYSVVCKIAETLASGYLYHAILRLHKQPSPGLVMIVESSSQDETVITSNLDMDSVTPLA